MSQLVDWASGQLGDWATVATVPDSYALGFFASVIPRTRFTLSGDVCGVITAARRVSPAVGHSD